MYNFPIWFLIQGSTAGGAGAHLLPTSIGNVLGGVTAGVVRRFCLSSPGFFSILADLHFPLSVLEQILSKTGKYQVPNIAAGLVSSVSLRGPYRSSKSNCLPPSFQICGCGPHRESDVRLGARLPVARHCEFASPSSIDFRSHLIQTPSQLPMGFGCKSCSRLRGETLLTLICFAQSATS